MCSSVSNQQYVFRSSTLEKRALTYSKPAENKSRTILPFGETPSLTATSTERVIDPSISKTKAELRIHTYFINSLTEIIHKTPLDRGKTSLQGTRATKGWQAAHSSLQPSTKDMHTLEVIEHIVDVGITPQKTKAFLKSRIDLTSPEAKILQENHTDSQFVTNFVLSRLPNGGEFSIIANSRYHWNCNATFENPDESNQYDSLLERKIKPFLIELQKGRLEGTLSAEESTAKLTKWLMDYYTESISNIKHQLACIVSASAYFEKLRAFELANLDNQELKPEDFKRYLSDMHEFLKLQNSLTEEKRGCPSCEDFKWTRTDFSFLKLLNKMAFEQNLPLDYISSHFLQYRRHLGQSMEFDRESFKTKYTLYLEEAIAQREATEVFTEPCTIPGLKKAFFGIWEGGARRAPTEKELESQIFDLSRIATPVKKKIREKRPMEQHNPSSVPLSPYQPKRSTTSKENIDDNIQAISNFAEKMTFDSVDTTDDQ